MLSKVDFFFQTSKNYRTLLLFPFPFWRIQFQKGGARRLDEIKELCWSFVTTFCNDGINKIDTGVIF